MYCLGLPHPEWVRGSMSLPVKNARASHASTKDDVWYESAGVSISVEAGVYIGKHSFSCSRCVYDCR
jgi:hypothetical protein